MTRLTFRPVLPAEYPLSEAFKRATFRDNLGDMLDFDTAFRSPRPSYQAFLKELQAFNPVAASFAHVKDELVGGVEMGFRPDDPAGQGFLFNIYLKPEWRGQGLGYQLEAYAMENLRAWGATSARLRTNAKNTRAMAFYHKAGWSLGEVSFLPQLVYMNKQL